METTNNTQHKAAARPGFGRRLRKIWRDQVAAQETLLDLNGPRITHRR